MSHANVFKKPSTEQATDGSLGAEDWALNMEICDMINDIDEG